MITDYLLDSPTEFTEEMRVAFDGSRGELILKRFHKLFEAIPRLEGERNLDWAYRAFTTVLHRHREVSAKPEYLPIIEPNSVPISDKVISFARDCPAVYNLIRDRDSFLPEVKEHYTNITLPALSKALYRECAEGLSMTAEDFQSALLLFVTAFSQASSLVLGKFPVFADDSRFTTGHAGFCDDPKCPTCPLPANPATIRKSTTEGAVKPREPLAGQDTDDPHYQAVS